MKVTAGETYKELTASQITKDCLYMLKLRGVFAERFNNHATRGRRNNTTKGRPDIQGVVMATGVSVLVEVKKLGDVLSKDQIKYLTQAVTHHRIVLIGTQYKDGSKLIDFIEYIK